jgi:hypothetical protein
MGVRQSFNHPELSDDPNKSEFKKGVCYETCAGVSPEVRGN